MSFFFPLKRCNMFGERLDWLQGKTQEEIPQELVDQIRQNLDADPANCTQHDVRAAIKKLRYSTHYENTCAISHRINGRPLPTLPPELEIKVKHMFSEAATAWPSLHPKRSFISHVYVAYKLLEMLDRRDLIQAMEIKLLSKEKVEVQDQLWQGVCEHLGWEFVPTT